MKEKILEILKDNKQNMTQDSWYGRQYGIPEDDFEDVADRIIELLEQKPAV